MPARFASLGISFQYPDNWTLDDSDAVLGRKSVTVYSPGGAFWSVAIQTGSAEPDKLAAAIVKTMQNEYQGLEAEPIEEETAGHELFGYDLAFYCLDLTNTACVRSFRSACTTYTIYYQAEDRDYEKLRQVFQAITLTLLNSVNDADDAD
jgi:hypothetical protein